MAFMRRKFLISPRSAFSSDFATVGLFLVGQVGSFEFGTVEIVQLRHFAGREQCPLAFLGDAFHEQVGNPVGGVHVVRAAALLAGVFAQVEEILDVQVPGFEIGAHRALALAALVDRDRGIVGDLEERHHAL
jgi:outer membrane receptor for Fe3+-dicitrate